MYLLPEDKKDYFFCALSKSFNNHTSNDYTFKVLLPEAILYLFAKVQRISRIKAEVLLSSYSLQRNNELLNKISDEDNDFIFGNKLYCLSSYEDIFTKPYKAFSKLIQGFGNQLKKT
ncbi:uncharacterized protein LOC124814721 [Hydra vulgaris]|uniref:uncharacterized protein LOC124814721 n=1 Tax=Hydra vulgaris TaxID=6087 RepID=UPI0032EA79BA